MSATAWLAAQAARAAVGPAGGLMMSNRYPHSAMDRLSLTPLKGPAWVPVVPPLPDFEQVLAIMAGRGTGITGLTAGTPTSGDASPVAAADDLISPDVPNLLVRVFLQSSRHTVLEGDGVNKGVLGRVVMVWSGERADEVFARDAFPIPDPGEALTYPTVHGIYRAIVFDGCVSQAAFPIAVSALIDIAPGVELGSFAASDADSIRPGGRWTFEFSVDASKDDGAHQSRFRFGGTIDATCTSLTDPDPFAP